MRLSYKKPPTWSKDKQGHLEMVPLTNLIMSSDSVWWRRYHPHVFQFSLCHPFFFPASFPIFNLSFLNFPHVSWWNARLFLGEKIMWSPRCWGHGVQFHQFSSQSMVDQQQPQFGVPKILLNSEKACVYFICNILVILFKCMYIIFWKDG